VAFEILPPWYFRPWWLAVWALLAAGLLTVAYRLRVAVLLELERQRTHIAMDLHDEVGSGLGSIHILSGLAADRVGSDSRLARLVTDITDTAADLSLSLSEIVWSLRSPSESLEMLIAHLTERATRLFPDGCGVTFRLEVPDPVPPVTLSLAVRRNVSLIVVEALHNAARHAHAAEVGLSLRPDGRRWIIEVADNGTGSQDVVGDDTGHGRAHMRRRATEIGASLAAANAPAGGHVVTLCFDPHARSLGR
jgi:signal transduction histidine kinase